MRGGNKESQQRFRVDSTCETYRKTVLEIFRLLHSGFRSVVFGDSRLLFFELSSNP